MATNRTHNCPVLTQPEIAALSARIQHGLAATGLDPASVLIHRDGIVARNDLTEANLPLITIVISHSHHRQYHPFDELFQEGAIGLMLAAEHYDPARNVKFATFASKCIRFALTNYCKRFGMIRIPNGVYRLKRLVDAAMRAQEQRGLDPDFVAACRQAGLTDQQAKAVRRANDRAVVLESSLVPPEAISPLDLIESSSPAELARQKACETVEALLEYLGPQYRTVLCERWGIGQPAMTIPEVRRQHGGVSKDWVARVEREAVRQVRVVGAMT